MKKTIIGALVGGLLIFIWQMLSWSILDLHRPSQDYTGKQDTLLSVLNTTLDKEGGYLVPGLPAGTSMDVMEKKSVEWSGKPWATIQYHKSLDADMNHMYKRMAMSLVSSMLMVWFLCWIISKWNRTSFGSVFTACIFAGLIVFINQPYSQYIWYNIFDVKAHLIDSLAAWGLCGIWLGWWMRRS